MGIDIDICVEILEHDFKENVETWQAIILPDGAYNWRDREFFSELYQGNLGYLSQDYMETDWTKKIGPSNAVMNVIDSVDQMTSRGCFTMKEFKERKFDSGVDFGHWFEKVSAYNLGLSNLFLHSPERIRVIWWMDQ